jgi:hypothetical protein
MYRGNYDGLGMTDQIIVMDQAISIELIEPSSITHIGKCSAKGARRALRKWCFEGSKPKVEKVVPDQ